MTFFFYSISAFDTYVKSVDFCIFKCFTLFLTTFTNLHFNYCNNISQRGCQLSVAFRFNMASKMCCYSYTDWCHLGSLKDLNFTTLLRIGQLCLLFDVHLF